MKIERTKNASRNIVFGFILKIYQTLLPFLMRTALIYWMGVEYTGLNSLFTSILQVLNLAELGVGSAMVFSMYRPIVEDDTNKICELLNLYRLYYRIIGLVIAAVGVALTPFVPRLIKSGVPADLNIYTLYLLNLAATVLTYWLYAYKSSILMAHQRNDIISKVTIFTQTIQYALQFTVLYFFRNYYIYLIVLLGSHLLNNIITARLASKIYPDYKPIGKLPKEETKAINKRVKDLFTAKIGTVIVNSADTIVISAFLGLSILAIYQNYFFIISAIIGFVTIIFNSCTAGIGNSLIVESKEKNYRDLETFTLLIVWISGFCACCLLNLFQPFMVIWVGKDLMLAFPAVICLCVYYFVYEINQLLNTYKDAGGIWHKDRFRPLVTALTNFGLNLIMVQFWGIYGVILSTVISMILVGMPWIIHNIFSTMFENHQGKLYVKKLALYTVVTAIIAFISYVCCNFIDFGKWSTFFIRFAVCIILPNTLYFVFFGRTEEFFRLIALLDKMTRGRLARFKKGSAR